MYADISFEEIKNSAFCDIISKIVITFMMQCVAHCDEFVDNRAVVEWIFVWSMRFAKAQLPNMPFKHRIFANLCKIAVYLIKRFLINRVSIDFYWIIFAVMFWKARMLAFIFSHFHSLNKWETVSSLLIKSILLSQFKSKPRAH